MGQDSVLEDFLSALISLVSDCHKTHFEIFERTYSGNVFSKLPSVKKTLFAGRPYRI
jgi:hypothetical protein